MKKGDIVKGKRIAFRIEDGESPQDVLATTYQMRNFYEQFRDGFASKLDVMNYIQHYIAAKRAPKGGKVLDVCCGRSLMLPLLRWYAKEIHSYTGVDLCTANIEEAKRGAARSASKSPLTTDAEINAYYPFRVKWIESLASEFSQKIKADSIDYCIYTSAIEHMHKDEGAQSLRECYKVMKEGARMFISCPNTEGDGYNTQYRAHIYEWKFEELKEELIKIGFSIERELGIMLGAKEMDALYQQHPNEGVRELYGILRSYIPQEWLSPILAVPYPQESAEMLMIAVKGEAVNQTHSSHFISKKRSNPSGFSLF